MRRGTHARPLQDLLDFCRTEAANISAWHHGGEPTSKLAVSASLAGNQQRPGSTGDIKGATLDIVEVDLSESQLNPSQNTVLSGLLSAEPADKAAAAASPKWYHLPYLSPLMTLRPLIEEKSASAGLIRCPTSFSKVGTGVI